jgi:hypothetical protein
MDGQHIGKPLGKPDGPQPEPNILIPSMVDKIES